MGKRNFIIFEPKRRRFLSGIIPEEKPLLFYWIDIKILQC